MRSLRFCLRSYWYQSSKRDSQALYHTGGTAAPASS